MRGSAVQSRVQQHEKSGTAKASHEADIQKYQAPEPLLTELELEERIRALGNPEPEDMLLCG